MTQAQENELRGRLSALQVRLSEVAVATRLRESAIRNIAVEIFGAQPDLPFEVHASLIETGARELRAYIDSARSRVDDDPELAALRLRAISAADEGRIGDARALYGEIIAINRDRRQRARAIEDMADARDHAEAAGLAVVEADFSAAAQGFALAADLAPDGSREKWQWRQSQGAALYQAAFHFPGSSDPAEAVRVQEVASGYVTQRAAPLDWALSQSSLGAALKLLGERGNDWRALERARQAFESSLRVYTRAANPSEWASAQNNLGTTLQAQGMQRRDFALIRRGVGNIEAALTAVSRDTDAASWGQYQSNLGVALGALGASGDSEAVLRGVAALEAAATVISYERDPIGWASLQTNISGLTFVQARLGNHAALDRSISAASEVVARLPRDRSPRIWASAQNLLGAGHEMRGDHGGGAASYETALVHYREALSVFVREAGSSSHQAVVQSISRAEAKRRNGR